ncbi:MAG TPA: right-handed parallel beta-helix repeat-containing protein [Alphaproteobacteria bacterium]|nr:right-handed parallel beta-helix repeat-containing protein [Alphaproteobacteria bacterium]
MTSEKTPHSGLSRRDIFAHGAGLTLSVAMATAAGAAPAMAETPAKVYRIGDFGAVGDGRADDTGAFERAIAAAARTGGVVEIPPGVYSVRDVWIGKNGDGKRPSIIGVHLKGAGMGATILAQRRAASSLGCVNMVDAFHCSLRELTVDSSALGDGPQNGGVLLFGCQNCLIENVEVRHSSHRSISIAGDLFGQGKLEARDTMVRGCVAWGQRVWNGDAAAQIIASDGAKTTQFVDCISEATGGWQGDLFGADDAPGTVFRGCRAYGNKAASAGFWVEEEKGERPAFFTDCSVADTRNVGIGGEEGAERMFIQNCYFYRVGKNAIRANGIGRVFVDGCFIEECGGSAETEDGAVLLQGDGSIQNTRFVNSTAKHAAVNLYTKDPAWPRGFARFSGCTFDKDVFIYQNAAQHVAFEGCTFLDRARIRTYNSEKTSIAASQCLFIQQGLELARVARVVLRDCAFRALDGYAGAALVGRAGDNPLTLSDCTFYNYKAITEGALTLRAEDNRFENCAQTLPAQACREAVFSAVMALDGRRSRVIPGTAAGNSYLVLVAPKDRKGEGAVFIYANGSPPRIRALADGAAPDRPDQTFALVAQDGLPALSHPSPVEAVVTVLKTGLGD